MFTTLVGTERGELTHRTLFDRLVALAQEQGFGAWPPHAGAQLEPRPGWTMEQRGPWHAPGAEFVLAVTAPRSPGISPVNPLPFPGDTPMFAVIVMDEFLCIWSEGRVSEARTHSAVETAFRRFLLAKTPVDVPE